MEKKYFTSCEEFDKKYKTGNKLQDGKSCFVITCLDGELPFQLGLTNIVVDDPQIKTKKGTQIIELVKHHLFDDINSFKNEFPNVKLKKANRFTEDYKKMDLKNILKKYKRIHRKE